MHFSFVPCLLSILSLCISSQSQRVSIANFCRVEQKYGNFTFWEEGPFWARKGRAEEEVFGKPGRAHSHSDVNAIQKEVLLLLDTDLAISL